MIAGPHGLVAQRLVMQDVAEVAVGVLGHLVRGEELEIEVAGRKPVGAVLEVPRLTDRIRKLVAGVSPGVLPAYVKVNTDRIRPTGRAVRTPRLKRYKGKKPDVIPSGMVWVPPGSFLFKVDHPWHGATCYGHYTWGRKGKRVNYGSRPP